MCIQNNLQSKIAELTNNGDAIAHFLADTMRGSFDAAIKTCHRLDAAKMLAKYGFPEVERKQDNRAPENPDDAGNSVPTIRDVVAYPTARHIRRRTGNGETLVSTLCHIMDGDEYETDPFTGARTSLIKPHHRIAAARELLRRAFGEKATRRSASFDGDAEIDWQNSLNAPLARHVRENIAFGSDAVEALLRVVQNEDKEWSPGNRLVAARELLHRAYDLNYDAVTWDHVDAYNRAANNAPAAGNVAGNAAGNVAGDVDRSADEHVDIGIAADVNDTADAMRERIRAGRTALIREFDIAYTAGDEEAMQLAEDKYNAYNSYISEGYAPEAALERASIGPSDPDPDIDYYYPPLSKEEQAKFDREVARYHAAAAAQVATPKLTIPINNRSP